jgi:hypothetical protein
MKLHHINHNARGLLITMVSWYCFIFQIVLFSFYVYFSRETLNITCDHYLLRAVTH